MKPEGSEPIAGNTSFRARFLCGVAAVSLIALLGTGLTLSHLFRQEIERQVDTRLSAHLDRLALVLESRDGKPALSRPLLEPRFTVPYSGLYWQIDGSGERPLRSRSLWDQSLPTPETTLAPGDRGRREVSGPDGATVLTLEEVLVIEGSPAPLHLSVAIVASEIEAPVARFQWLLAVAFAVLMSVLLVGSAIAAWVGIRPLDRLRVGLNRIHAREISRLGGGFPSELRPLIHDLNELLEDREQSIKRARTQAGNLAHALKTPLSVIANEAAAADRAGASGQAEILRDAVDAMERNIHHQLARSRAAAAARDTANSAAVAPVVQRLAQAMPILHQGSAINCSVSIPEQARVRIDAEDLTEILGNLMDNAFGWAESRVEISGRDDMDTYIIIVDDDGPGLSKEQAERVVRRGERLDETRPGTGLGLSIVAELLELFDGALELDRSEIGGTRAIVRLPAVRDGDVQCERSAKKSVNAAAAIGRESQ
jgi:signal transduction histidine kinase